MPARPVLFYNPKSGGGKAERFRLADEARARDIEPIELELGTDLEQLVRAAVAEGADGLAMAGGDGSQAIVAEVASELGLPYACIPAGTRNHFALDLGVDRDDVVGALDAFVDGGEHVVDLAEVNGRVFVNNVSLGLYAEAVQRKGYREAKLKTILDTMPDTLGPEGQGLDLRWTRARRQRTLVRRGDPRLQQSLPARHRGGRGDQAADRRRACSGSRSSRRRRAGGGSGHGLQRPWREWSAPEFTVEADGPIPAGIDGEALVLESPLRFRIRPGVLRARIATAHPGASPSAAMPERLRETASAVLAVAVGRTAHQRGVTTGQPRKEEQRWTCSRSSRRKP